MPLGISTYGTNVIKRTQMASLYKLRVDLFGTLSDLTGLRFESQTYRSREERVLATAATYVERGLLPGRNNAEMGPRKLVTHFGIVQRVQ